MVLAEYPVEHVVSLFLKKVLPLHGDGAELDELLLDELVSDKHPNSSALAAHVQRVPGVVWRSNSRLPRRFRYWCYGIGRMVNGPHACGR